MHMTKRGAPLPINQALSRRANASSATPGTTHSGEYGLFRERSGRGIPPQIHRRHGRLMAPFIPPLI
jgi:hypothetical protein